MILPECREAALVGHDLHHDDHCLRVLAYFNKGRFAKCFVVCEI